LFPAAFTAEKSNETSPLPGELELYKLRLYPNLLRKNNFINIDIPREDKIIFEIYNMLGDKLIDQTLIRGHHRIPIRLRPGMYICKISVSKEVNMFYKLTVVN